MVNQKKQVIKIAKVSKPSVLDTPEKITAAMITLKQDPGWLLLVKILNDNIKVTEKKLHGSLDWDENDTLISLQDKRNDRMELKRLPDRVIDRQKKVEAGEISFDPYD